MEPKAKRNRYKADRKKNKENTGRVFINGIRLIVGFSGLLILSAGFVFIHDCITQWDYFRSKTVWVEGLHRLSRDTVLTQAQVDVGKSVLAMNLSRARRRLLAHPWIVEATVKRQLPDTVEIRIQEETPLALVDLGKRFLINTQGVIFKEWSVSDPEDLPVIRGLDFSDIQTPDSAPSAAWETALAVLKQARRSDALIPTHAIQSVHADPETGITLCLFEGGKAVHMGFRGLESKHAGLKQALFQLNLIETVVDFDAIDVMETDRIVVIPVRTGSVSETSREA